MKGLTLYDRSEERRPAASTRFKTSGQPRETLLFSLLKGAPERMLEEPLAEAGAKTGMLRDELREPFWTSKR